LIAWIAFYERYRKNDEARYQTERVEGLERGDGMLLKPIKRVRFYENAVGQIQSLREALIIPYSSLPPRIKHGVNSGGSPVISSVSGFRLSPE